MMNMTLITWAAAFPCVLLPAGLIFRLLGWATAGQFNNLLGVTAMMSLFLVIQWVVTWYGRRGE